MSSRPPQNRDLRFGVVLFFFLVVFEGALRKWVFPGQQQLLFIAKDVVLCVTLVVYFLRFGLHLPVSLRHKLTGGLLIAYVGWSVFEALNWSLPNFLLGIWGLKSHVLYCSFLLLIPAAFPSTEDLYRAVKKYAFLAVPILALGIAQFYAPSDSALNAYAHSGVESITTFGRGTRFVRVTGTFPYITGMSTYVFFALLLGLALFAARSQGGGRRWPVYLLIILGAVVTPMNGSRWPVYIWLIILPVFLYELYRLQLMDGRTSFRFGILAVLCIVALAWYGEMAVQTFADRVEMANDEKQRVENVLFQPFWFLDEAGFIGYGAGATYQGASQLVPGVRPYSWLPDDIYFEDAPGRLLLELGLIGFFIVMSLKLGLCFLAQRTAAMCRDPRMRVLCVAALCFMLAHLTRPIVFNLTAGALFWGFAGVLVKIANDVKDESISHATHQRA